MHFLRKCSSFPNKETRSVSKAENSLLELSGSETGESIETAMLVEEVVTFSLPLTIGLSRGIPTDLEIVSRQWGAQENTAKFVTKSLMLMLNQFFFSAMEAMERISMNSEIGNSSITKKLRNTVAHYPTFPCSARPELTVVSAPSIAECF